MLMKEKKKGLALIIAKMKGPKMEETSVVGPEEAMQDKSIAMDSCAEEILAAIERKDSKMLSEALKAFADMVKEDDSQESED